MIGLIAMLLVLFLYEVKSMAQYLKLKINEAKIS
jgi:hypothetical protein